MKSDKKYILGNWKMNKTFNNVYSYFNVLNKLIKRDKIIVEKLEKEIILGIAPSFISILPALNCAYKNINILPQDISANISGAFTSQVSVKQISEYNIKYCLIGHSETRTLLGFNDFEINLKLKNLIDSKIKPVLCIGETLKQFETNKTINILSSQVENALKDISKDKINEIIIAYEPIWAIGTSITPSNEQIFEHINIIQEQLIKMFGDDVVKKVPILYGGSVSEKNAHDILNIKNVSGLLVGGASLEPTVFFDILSACKVPEKNVKKKCKFCSFLDNIFLRKNK